MRALLAIALISCGPMGRYNETLSGEMSEHLSLATIDGGFELFFTELEKDDLMYFDVAADIVGRHFVHISSRPEPWLEMVRTSKNGEIKETLVAGVYHWPGWLEVQWRPDLCVADTAIIHELAHLLLCWRGSDDESLSIAQDCDHFHEQLAWWDAMRTANEHWRLEACK